MLLNRKLHYVEYVCEWTNEEHFTATIPWKQVQKTLETTKGLDHHTFLDLVGLLDFVDLLDLVDLLQGVPRKSLL